MTTYPEFTTHPWNDLVVGGSAGESLIFKLYETSLMDNGSFEEELSGWDGSGDREDFGSNAAHGNYVLGCRSVEYMHTAFARLSADTGSDMDSILFAGYIKATSQLAGTVVRVLVYASASSARVASPASFVQLNLLLDDDCMQTDAEGLTQWIRFYLAADISSLVGDYVHFEIASDDYSTVDYYLDELKVYEIKETVLMECAQSLNLSWARETDANYSMADGANKDYVRGWRPLYGIGYEYCSRQQLIENIGITENGFNFFAPQRDSANGEFVRMVEDLSASYFKDRFLGHESQLPLIGIFLRKYKTREYGEYFFVELP